MRRTVVLNLVGLTEALIGEVTPNLRRLRQTGSFTRIVPAFPAVTCTAQADYLTGRRPRHHGIVGNGWYHRVLAEVHFWKQSNHLVTAPKLWETLRARDPAFTCAKLFWWFNMYSTADYSITPRPMYPADGRKVFDIYTRPAEMRHSIQRDLGPFPFATFWGPAAGVASPQGPADAASRWIAAAAQWIEERYQPTLSLVYLPHLDYNLQRHGVWVGPAATTAPASAAGPPPAMPLRPEIVPDLQALDTLAGELITFYARRGVPVVVLSEYGLTNVDRPIHLNRLFRRQGWLAVREELGRELLDPGASDVFAVADHQVAHLYLRDLILADRVRTCVEAQTGTTVLGPAEKAALELDHPRAGDLVAVAPPDAWFTYYYWEDDRRAPDFARTVDIHRKPGYDPVELFSDPALSPLALRLRVAWRLLQKRLGFRMLMDIIPLDASLVRGSHGRRPENPAHWPVLLTTGPGALPAAPLASTDVAPTLLRLICSEA